MATLTPPITSGSVSSLIKSANSIAAANQTFEDNQANFNFEQNVILDPAGAFATYRDYLSGRITNLNSIGGPTNGSKAISLTNTLQGAQSKMTSTRITQENIQVMAGNASPTDKYNLIGDLYTQALGNGDLTLAQSLMSESYTLSQTIQEQQQTSDAAAATLAKASATKEGTAEKDVASSLTDDLKAFNTEVAHAGTQSLDKITSAFVSAHKAQFDALGVVLKPGMKPNYFDIVSGTNQAIFAAYNAAGDAVAPYADDGGQSYYDKATGVVNSIPTIYGSMNANQLTAASNNPNAYAKALDPDLASAQPGSTTGAGGKENPQVGYRYDPKLGIIPVANASPWVNVPNNLNYRLQQLGLSVVSGTTKGGESAGQGVQNGVEVTSSKNTPAWLVKAIPSNATTHIFVQPNGDLQFESQTKQGVAIYTATATNQLYARDGETGDYLHLGGQPGGGAGLKATSGAGRVTGMDGRSAAIRSDFLSTESVNQLTAKAQNITAQNAKTLATNQAAALAMLPKTIAPLPTISTTPPAVSPVNPNVQVQKTTYPVAPTTSNPQTQATPKLQGGNFNLQGGGQGIKL